MEKINPFAYLYYHLYLLQLEEYNLARFLVAIWNTRAIPPVTLRKKLVFTPKMLLISVFTLSLIIGFSIRFSIGFLLVFYISFLPIIIVCIILTPLDVLLKNMKIQKAKKIMARYPLLKVIGIAGSYGKTTMKEAVSTILSEKFTVLKTPENINTPLGIADLIIKKLNSDTQILVVEMGEYTRGDIAQICSIVKPQIGIITGINEAHLERMGNIENTTAAIFELAEHTDKDGVLVLNSDIELIRSNYKKYIAHQKIVLYSSMYKTDLKSELLGRYAKGVLQAAEAVALHLGMGEAEIALGASKIKALPHRLQPIEGARGVLVIDDSYNGNPAGVNEAIYVLSTYHDRRKVYVTPGLVETGDKTAEIHRAIGKELSGVANLVILIENSATPFIAEGLMANGFQKENIKWYKSSEAAHADMVNIIQPDDVVLFQNDWTDNYV
jgi:UDP-N-acetylmuramoyl-tripeptide--D-alanyl-D-alanine ligase